MEIPEDSDRELPASVIEDMKLELGLCFNIHSAIDRVGTPRREVLQRYQEEYEGFTDDHIEYALRYYREIYRKEPGWLLPQPDMLDLSRLVGH